jgi:hypothetical protein
MRQDLKMACIYTFVLVLPLLLVLGSLAFQAGQVSEWVTEFMRYGVMWPLLLTWPWLIVLWNRLPFIPRSKGSDA